MTIPIRFVFCPLNQTKFSNIQTKSVAKWNRIHQKVYITLKSSMSFALDCSILIFLPAELLYPIRSPIILSHRHVSRDDSAMGAHDYTLPNPEQNATHIKVLILTLFWLMFKILFDMPKSQMKLSIISQTVFLQLWLVSFPWTYDKVTQISRSQISDQSVLQ